MSEKTIGYQYNPISYELMGEITLQRDPLDSKILMPPNTTTLKPIQCNENEVAIYNISRKKWDKTTDYRGKWYNKDTGEEVEIKTLYDISLVKSANPVLIEEELRKKNIYNYDLSILTLLSGEKLVKENPHNHHTGLDFKYLEWSFYDKCFMPKTDLTDLLKLLIENLKKEFNNKQKENISYKGYPIDTDEKSINIIQQKMICMQDNEEKISWLNSNNDFLELTKYDLFDIMNIIQKRNQILFVSYQNAKKDILQCKTYKELESIMPNWLENTSFKNSYNFELFEKYINGGKYE